MCGFMALYKFDFNFNFNLNATRSGTYSKASVLQVGLPSRAQSVASNTNPVTVIISTDLIMVVYSCSTLIALCYVQRGIVIVRTAIAIAYLHARHCHYS